jgi:hypothetical protein
MLCTWYIYGLCDANVGVVWELCVHRGHDGVLGEFSNKAVTFDSLGGFCGIWMWLSAPSVFGRLS